jgi:hypothetical protein
MQWQSSPADLANEIAKTRDLTDKPFGAVFTAQVGRAKVAAYLLAAERLFHDAQFRYVNMCCGQLRSAGV